MRTVKLSGHDLTVPKSTAFACETPADMPKMHLLAAVVSKRGTGKSVLTASFIEQLHCVDRLMVVSPSALSNKVLLDRFKQILAPEDIFSDVNDITVIDQIIERVEAERDDYERYHAELKRYNQLMRALRSEMPLFQIPDDDLPFGSLQPPKHKWGGRKPIIMVWFDDILGSQLMLGRGARKIAQLCIYHRHAGQLKEGGAIGISLIFCVQSYISAQGGLPKALRNNITLLFLGKTKSDKELDEVAREVGGEVDKQTFMRAYEYATAEPFSMLMVDFHKKDHHPSMFRKNLGEFIVV